MAFYKNKWGELASTFGMPGAQEEAQDKYAHEGEQARGAQSSAENIGAAANKSAEARAQAAASAQIQAAQAQADAHRAAAQAAANAQIEAARLNAQRGGGGGGMLFNSRTQQYYNKGGPVISGEFKHAHPTYTKFGQTGDSSLLAKGRR